MSKNVSTDNLLLFNKPFQVMCQFTDEQDRKTLADFIKIPDFYAAGRLDYDSEGLVLLTNDGALQHQIANPKNKMPKTYWVQVEGEITAEAIIQLQRGVTLKDGPTRPAKAARIEAPDVSPRNPPIRERKNIPTSWIALTITEGRNRQVRRMTAAVDFPTLRLIRVKIGNWEITGIKTGEFKKESVHLPKTKTSTRYSERKKTQRRKPIKLGANRR